MARYFAPKPQSTYGQWFKFIAIRLILPPLLLWDILKFLINKLAGAAVGRLVLKGQTIDFSNVRRDDVKALDTETLKHVKHRVITYDGAHLDTFEIQHQSQKMIEIEQRKYIINFCGNATSYENIIAEMQEDANALNCHVIGFNFRGVSQSLGRARSKNDLITDGIAQVQRLLDKGIKPEHITLKGHSLGAAIATLVTQYFHQQGKPLRLFNGRSFSSLTNVLVGFIRTGGPNYAGHKESHHRKLLGWLAKPFIKLALLLTNWEINAGDAFKAIPAHDKEYTVVRTKRQERFDSILDDTIISHYASIHAYLKNERRAQKAQMAHLLSSPAPDDSTLVQLEKNRAKFKERKFTVRKDRVTLASLFFTAKDAISEAMDAAISEELADRLSIAKDYVDAAAQSITTAETFATAFTLYKKSGDMSAAIEAAKDTAKMDADAIDYAVRAWNLAYKVLKETEREAFMADPTSDIFTLEDDLSVIKALAANRAIAKAAWASSINGHQVDTKELQNPSGKTATMFFREFVQRDTQEAKQLYTLN